MKQRIAKFIADTGTASRRDAENLITSGRVAVDGVIIDSPVFFVDDTNIVTIITKSGEKQLELMDKSEVAGKILDSIISCYNK